MRPVIYKFPPTYRRDSGLWVEDLKPETIRLPDKKILFSEVSLVRIPSKQFGGNHKHLRIEMFTALSEGLELVWLDEHQKDHVLMMEYSHDKEITFYLIPSNLAHVVHNAGLKDAYFLEYADRHQSDVELVDIL